MENRYLANETLDKLVIGTLESAKWRHKHIGENEVPCCSWAEKTIYSPVLPPLVDPVADSVIRGKNAHEAGHARLTRSDKNPAWSTLKCNVVNALEDLRIEAGVGKLSAAIAEDIKTMNKSVVGEIQKSWSIGKCPARPLDEALFALSIMEQGFAPCWQMGLGAQKYISAARDAFGKWKQASQDVPEGFAKIVEVADEVVKRLEQAKQEMENEKGNQGNQGNQGKQDGSQQGEGGKGNADKPQGGSSESDKRGESQDSKDSENKPKEGAGRNEEGRGDNNANNGNNRGKGEKNAENEDNRKGDENGRPDGKAESGIKRGRAEITPDDFDGRDFRTESLKKIIGKAVGEAKKELANAGIEYTAYTQEDEVREAESRPSRYEASRQNASGMVAKLRSHLEQMLRSMSRCRVVRNREGGDLDASRLADLAKSLTRNVFTETMSGISLDTTVSILIDESGSIGRTCEVFQTMAIAFSEALERLGIKYEILGHTTKSANNHQASGAFVRSRPMLVLEHKRFDEPLRKAKYKLGSIGSFGCNADGEALLHTWKRAVSQRAKRHIVFVLSDGEPNGAKSHSGNQMLCRHLKSVADRIRKDGGEVYAIGIGTTSPKKFYGEKYFFYAGNEKSINEQFFRNIANVIARNQK